VLIVIVISWKLKSLWKKMMMYIARIAIMNSLVNVALVASNLCWINASVSWIVFIIQNTLLVLNVVLV